MVCIPFALAHRSFILRCICILFNAYHSTFFYTPATSIELTEKESYFSRHIAISDGEEWVRDKERKKWLKQKSARWKRELCTIAMRLKNIMPCWLVERAKFIRLIRIYLEMHDTHHTHTHTLAHIHSNSMS